MTRHSCYWYIDGISYDWPMTVEIDENESEILSVTIPIEIENGETVDMRFLPESENGKMLAERIVALEELVQDLWDRLCDKDEICGECRMCDHEACNYESRNCVYNRRLRELGLKVRP